MFISTMFPEFFYCPILKHISTMINEWLIFDMHCTEIHFHDVYVLFIYLFIYFFFFYFILFLFFIFFFFFLSFCFVFCVIDMSYTVNCFHDVFSSSNVMYWNFYLSCPNVTYRNSFQRCRFLSCSNDIFLKCIFTMFMFSVLTKSTTMKVSPRSINYWAYFS